MSLGSLLSAVYSPCSSFLFYSAGIRFLFQPLFSICILCPAHIISSSPAFSKTFISSPSFSPSSFVISITRSTQNVVIESDELRLNCANQRMPATYLLIYNSDIKDVWAINRYIIFMADGTFVDTANNSSCFYVPFSAL